MKITTKVCIPVSKGAALFFVEGVGGGGGGHHNNFGSCFRVLEVILFLFYLFIFFIYIFMVSAVSLLTIIQMVQPEGSAWHSGLHSIKLNQPNTSNGRGIVCSLC